MKTTIWMQACLAVLLASGTSARAVDPWPAESSAAAVRLTDIDPGLDTVNWSGAFWNPDTRTLWICCNSGTFWALVENGAGIAQMAVFVSTLMMVGVATAPLEASFCGWRATILRNGMAYFYSFVVGYAVWLTVAL